MYISSLAIFGPLLATFASAAPTTSTGSNRILQTRASDYISSCGPKSGWTPVGDFNRAVDSFCDQAGGKVVGSQQYLSITIGGITLTSGSRGHVEFEIHNKIDSSHTVDAGSCKGYLKKLSEKGSECYGSNHDDTKGGTWQVGNDAISYHGLPAAD